ncbi:FKBP-type peptidyl-prolyl cis-trans isomerase [Chitinophaga sp. XS-30]|uniref:FKBP-type peptidyl-prolyl cis-trans isomerase n=1 Tax=Chitinophaga sp. XS-30 TaxID=2604421 RepID=UPI0011DD0B5E|nr:FKBP-type peptidyl-prolyl cis-trans isomerase [Chitinophaga sp. XS-30]QEH41703.1 peptidylprolyl isomerase [Chitinophaga sp. XS-30]
MKRHYFGLLGLLAVLMFTACKKKKDDVPHDPVKQAAIDEQLIQQYIADSSITGTMKDDTSGLHYKILARGTTPNDTITLEDRMNISYTGKLLNGNVFETRDNNTLGDARLKNLVQGWQIGLRKIAKGDKVLLLIPSGLGYKTSSSAAIPANSVLVFEITLNNFYY